MRSNIISEKFTHVGWVPCVLGHLDFGLMKVGLSGCEVFGVIPKRDNEEITVNFAYDGDSDDNGRRIIISTWYDWKDKIQSDGQFRVILSAESNKSSDMDNRYLKGHLCIMPNSYGKHHAETYSYYMDDVINIKDTSLKKLNDKQETLNEYWKKISDKLSKGKTPDCHANKVYFVEFYIGHSGITHLSYLPTNVDNKECLSEKAQYGILRQAFYYIKYTLHTHKHHTKESDALTTIVKMDREDVTNDGKRLVAQIKRELTRIKRTQNENHYRRDESSAHGIIGYLKSLIATCCDIGLLTKEQQSRELSWLEGASGSFTAQHEIMTIQINDRGSVKSSSRQWAGFLLASASIPTLLWVNLSKRDNGSPPITNSTNVESENIENSPITTTYFQDASVVEYIIFAALIFCGVLVAAKVLEIIGNLKASNSHFFLLLPKIIFKAGYRTCLISIVVTLSFIYVLWEHVRPQVVNLMSYIIN